MPVIGGEVEAGKSRWSSLLAWAEDKGGAHAWGGAILGAAVVPWLRRWQETVGAGGMAATAGSRGRKMPCWLTCGPSVPFNLIYFSKAPTSKFTNMIFPMSKNGETFWGDQWDNKEQLSFLATQPNPSGFWIRKSRNNSNLNLAWILKGSNHSGKIW
jgi:hypothetical protein